MVNSKPANLIRLLSVLLAMAWLPGSGAEPVRVVFDTDIGNDVDDALALAMLHALESRGEVKLLAVTITKDNRWAAPYVSLVNTFYGRGEIPIGVVKNGKTPKDSDMIRIPAERRDSRGQPLYPHSLRDGTQAPEAVGLLRRILAAQPDRSVTLIQTGFSTNLARLLDSQGGHDLVARKVRLLSVMAGQFPTGKPEYNVRTDVTAAQKLFREWPTPIVASGYEIGESILYPARSIEEDYRYVEHHPIADAYRNYKKMPYDRPTWDLTSVLYAARPDRGYFSLSPPGRIQVDSEGKTRLEPDPIGRHRYLIVNEVERTRCLEAMMYLASQPPQGLNPQ
jgi:inosine-uridine nucleoside N-ribohydrolase